MSFLNKVLGIASIPVGLLIVLEQMEIFSVLPDFDKVLIGAILAFVVQSISLFMAHSHGEKMEAGGESHLRPINVIMFVVLVAPSVLYGISFFANFPFLEHVPLMIGIVLIIEGLYSLH